jgi:hypothetical protein
VACPSPPGLLVRIRLLSDRELKPSWSAVTVDVDQANIRFSPVDDGDGANFAKVMQYQQEYMAGRQSLQDAKYREALLHLRKADEIIRSRPEWIESK